MNVDKLLSKLTLEERVSLLASVDWWRTKKIDREGVFVPHLKTTDGPNGARGESYVSGIKAACFPCATSMGSTFDVDLAFEIGREIAKEAKTKSANILLGPTLNMIRSPLGGRNYETYSEDPHVLGEMASAFVKGCQSEGIAATPKHFVANDAESQRTKLSAEIDEQTLRELYLYPFQLVVKSADPLCLMTSYNKVNGKYVADDGRLVNKVLREEWAFKGVVMSDWLGVYSTSDCINAGVDLEMPGPTKWRGEKLIQAVKQGMVAECTIENSARRLLELMARLNRFQNPNEAPEREVEDEQRDEFIARSGAEGMVLLKNDRVLPLPRGSEVALIGQFANEASMGGGGSARVDALHAISPLEGMTKAGFKISYSPGIPVYGALPHVPEESLYPRGKLQQDPRPVKLEWFSDLAIGNNLALIEYSKLPEFMIKEKWPEYLSPDKKYSVRMTFDIVPRTTGRHIFSVITTGRAKCYIDNTLLFERNQEQSMIAEPFYFFKSKMERRFRYSMVANRRYEITLDIWGTDLDVLMAPPLRGHLMQGTSIRFQERVDHDTGISHAAKTAAGSEYAIVCVGTTNEMESEGFDRDTMELTPGEYEMIAQVCKSNPKTIVVNFSGAPVDLRPFVSAVPAILQAWYPGMECGHSVAKVLSGAVNPCGRLPLSWPAALEDNPSFGNFPVDANVLIRYEEALDVGYRYYDREGTPSPLFPFGYGLSYTTFEISHVQVTGSKDFDGTTGKISVSCNTTNTGKVAGKLAVQIYVSFPNVSVGHARPPKELKAFSKVFLHPGEIKNLELTLDKYAVSYYDATQKCWVAQKGEYRVSVGQSSVHICGHDDFKVLNSFTWNGI